MPIIFIMVSLSKMSPMYQLMEEFVRCDTITLSWTWSNKMDSPLHHSRQLPREKQWHTIMSFSPLLWLLLNERRTISFIYLLDSTSQTCLLLHFFDHCLSQQDWSFSIPRSYVGKLYNQNMWDCQTLKSCLKYWYLFFGSEFWVHRKAFNSVLLCPSAALMLSLLTFKHVTIIAACQNQAEERKLNFYFLPFTVLTQVAQWSVKLMFIRHLKQSQCNRSDKRQSNHKVFFIYMSTKNMFKLYVSMKKQQKQLNYWQRYTWVLSCRFRTMDSSFVVRQIDPYSWNTHATHADSQTGLIKRQTVLVKSRPLSDGPPAHWCGSLPGFVPVYLMASALLGLGERKSCRTHQKIHITWSTFELLKLNCHHK